MSDQRKIEISESISIADKASIVTADSADVKFELLQTNRVTSNFSGVEPAKVLPTAYKTVSHNISERINSNVEADEFENESIMNLKWHRTDLEDLCDSLGTDVSSGLTEEQVLAKRKEFGENVQSKAETHWVKDILTYLFGGFGIVFLVAGVLFIICWKPLGDPPAIANLALGIVLLVIFVIQAILNWFQDFSSSRVMQSVNNLLPTQVKCIRDGNLVILKINELVPGDIVYLENDTKIPADIRICQSENLLFDKSILNGESRPVKGAAYSNEPNILENESIAMQGTLCIGGYGKGIVVGTGDKTIFGKITRLSTQARTKFTTLQIEMFRFIGVILTFALLLVVIILIVWGAYVRHRYPEWLNAPNLVSTLISCFFVVVPEGVPISFATVLLITAKKMKDSKILCKSLLIVETLGSVSVLCSDKTGTLTTGKMVVTSTYGNIKKLKLFSGLCNESVLEDGKITRGNATDKALLGFAIDGTDTSTLSNYKLISEIPFNSKNKYSAKSFQVGDSDKYLAIIKGAPDYLMKGATSITMEDFDTALPLDDSKRKELVKLQSEWAKSGERVVLVGHKYIAQDDIESEETLATGLTIVGLLGLSDPLRDQIPEVIQGIKEAGIKTVMITGDFDLTAVSIARKSGIITSLDVDTIDSALIGTAVSGSAVVINGPEMFRLSEPDWDWVIDYDEIVFSRTSPEQKLRIVKEFQKRKFVVGMTGDGVNDAPSLKQADVGISMADATDIAKEASDLIMLDSFVSMVDAIKYGRLVFENLRKTICYLLPAGTYSEMWPVLLYAIWGFPQMLSSFLMIIICAVTDCIASMIISYEEEEADLLKKPPRSVTGEKLVDWKLFLHSYITVGTYYCFTAMLLAFLNFTRHGYTFAELHKFNITDEMVPILNRSSSIYFVHLVILQAFNLVTVRTRRLSCIHNFNYKLLIVCPIFASTFIWNYIPALQVNLATETVPVEYYFISIGFGALLLVYDELRKLCVRKYPKSLIAKVAW